MDISIVIPVFNEEENVSILHGKLVSVLNKIGKKYEIIFVDDGSKDKTFVNLFNLKPVKIVRHRTNFGQTAAMLSGIRESKGKIIITMDGDLQNDPEDIPLLLEKMDEGFDVVSGWRANRKDTFGKRIFSKIANKLRGMLIKDPIHDSGCSLKAYKRECFDEIDLYGEMHRYIPALLNWKGFKISEVKVKHFKRKFGKTKYGLGRILKGFMDLINVWFWRKFSSRPLHIFGGLGIVLGILGGLFGLYLGYLRLTGRISLVNSSLPLLAILMVIIGVQLFVSGLLADIAVKSYYGHNGRKTYSIKEIVEKR